MTGFLLVASHFCYDNPAVLEDAIEEKFNVTQTEYSLLYTFYSYPNLVMPLIGGIMIDKIGVQNSIIIFQSFLLLG